MSEHEAKKPWWNDADKVAGAAATIIGLALAIVVAACIIALGLRVAIWLFG